MKQIVKYPIGEQNFMKVRKEGMLYVDKTKFIEQLLDGGGMYYFLARPRRFGKSLFLSTLEYFFRGERGLFKGLYIDSIDWDWEEYPVLRLDLNREKYLEKGKFDAVLDKTFRDWEEKYNVEVKDTNLAQRFESIIEGAHKKTGKGVVVLIDEYDKPLVANINRQSEFENFRGELAAIYSVFKSSAEYLKMVFLTGVSRFSKLSIFSDLNNLRDLTFTPAYADICGITAEELLTNCTSGISAFATANNVSFDEAHLQLKTNYDGYRFTSAESEIYNPWSVLNALADLIIGNYWNRTGFPSLIAETLHRLQVNLKDYLDACCTAEELSGLDLFNPSPIALMFQTGYLTVKEYYPRLNMFRLGIPNKEVREGLVNTLIPLYVKNTPVPSNELVKDIAKYFLFGMPEKAMASMQAYFAGVDYALRIENENNFHNALYLLMDMIGLNTHTESHTSDGRIDIEILTSEYIYIIELKYNHSAESALHQIKDKRYSMKHQMDNRKIYEIGVEFSSTTRRIENWLIDESK